MYTTGWPSRLRLSSARPWVGPQVQKPRIALTVPGIIVMVRRLTTGGEGFAVLPLIEEPMLIVVPTAPSLASRAAVPLADLGYTQMLPVV
jgi:hypothetical protein